MGLGQIFITMNGATFQNLCLRQPISILKGNVQRELDRQMNIFRVVQVNLETHVVQSQNIVESVSETNSKPRVNKREFQPLYCKEH